MIHNLTPKPNQVWITYDIDFIPATSPAAQGIKPARPIWMDVQNGETYPVFDVLQGTGTGRRVHLPRRRDRPVQGRPPKNEWTVDQDGVLLGTAGHVHPGGLHDDLWLQRAGATAPTGTAKAGAPDTVHLFSSKAALLRARGRGVVGRHDDGDAGRLARAGAQGRRAVGHRHVRLEAPRRGTSRWGSWSCGWRTATPAAPTRSPSRSTSPGVLTHGHLPENDNHGGTPDAEGLRRPDEAPVAADRRPDRDRQLRLRTRRHERRRLGADDRGRAEHHVQQPRRAARATASGTRSPRARRRATASTGIAYPLADGDGARSTPVSSAPAGRRRRATVTWSTPTNLPPGTYTYFCRIHPFMRGAFRVVQP